MTQIRFGTDGWRGVIADDFTFDNVRRVAYAIARYIVRAEQPSNGVLIGYDNRFGGERFARVAAETFAMTGTPVFLATAPCPSPAISLLVRQRGAAGGIMITASHNPARWNGIKFKASYGSSPLPSMVAEIEKELATVLAGGVPPLPPRKELIQPLDILTPYLDTVEKLVDWEKLRGAGLRFVVDPMHGAARGLLATLLRRHGVACEEIRGTRDPLFGGVNPEPIEPHIAALQDAVKAGKYDAGFAADGDGDRIGAVDRDGTFITPHQIFSILFWHLAGARQLPGDLAKTFSTTKLLDKIAAHFGRQVYEVPVGFKYICELMLERDILLGGEESGGIGTSLYLPERDATVSALLLAEVMAWHRKSLGELVAMLHAEFGEHHYGRVDLELRPGQKERALEYFAAPKRKRLLDWPIARREDMDGIKVFLDDGGWVMVRASGTEDMLRIYSETTRPETTRDASARRERAGHNHSGRSSDTASAEVPQSALSLLLRGGFPYRSQQGIENAVDERRGVLGRKFLGHFDGLVEHYFGWSPGGAEFIGRQPQDGPVNHREAFRAPVFSVGGNPGIQVRRAIHRAFKQLVGKGAGGFFGARNLPEAAFDSFRLLVADLPLEQHLQCVLAGLMPEGHASGASVAARREFWACRGGCARAGPFPAPRGRPRSPCCRS